MDTTEFKVINYLVNLSMSRVESIPRLIESRKRLEELAGKMEEKIGHIEFFRPPIDIRDAKSGRETAILSFYHYGVGPPRQ